MRRQKFSIKEKRQVAFTVFVDPGKRAYVRRARHTSAVTVMTVDEVIRQEVRQMKAAGTTTSGSITTGSTRPPGTILVLMSKHPPVPTTDQVDVNFNVTEKSTRVIFPKVLIAVREKLFSFNLAVQYFWQRYSPADHRYRRPTRSGSARPIPYLPVDGVSQVSTFITARQIRSRSATSITPPRRAAELFRIPTRSRADSPSALPRSIKPEVEIDRDPDTAAVPEVQ